MGGRFALLIGTGSFRDGSLPHLDSAPADVRDLAALLRDPYVAGFDPVIELVDANTQQVGREIAHILDRRHRDDLVLLYYAGHALFDDEGQLHLAMHDTELDLLSPTSISAAFVAAEMDRSRSRRQLLVLDCRFGSGLAHGTKGAPLSPSKSSPGHVAVQLADAQLLASAFHTEGGRGRVIFAGCDDPGRHSTVPGFRRSQVPIDANDPPNSAFTHALIEGLRGAADVDRDGRITIDELYEYAHGQLAQRTTNPLPCRRGEASAGVPIAYAPRRPSVAPAVRTSRPPGPGALISDRYLTLSILEEGGLGIVFAARDERTGQPVSLRILRPPGSIDAATLERFLREAQIASALDHPNVVRILELGFEGRTAFIVMEPLDGESLGRLLRRKPRLELAEALEILLPAMSAVSAAHAQNVLHRDLNPDNIFVNRNPNGTVAGIKVLGFGMSTMLDEPVGSVASRGIRSPHYVPPEQLLGKSKLDVRADVYAFGVILYEALTGRRPFSADNHAAVLYRIGAGEAEAPSVVCPELPSAVDQIIRIAMSKDRGQRYADVESLRYALQDAARDHGWVSTFDSSVPAPTSSRERERLEREVKIETPAVFERPFPNQPPPRASRSWIAGVTLLAAAGGAAGWLLSGSFTDEPPNMSSAAQPPPNAVRPATAEPALPPQPAAGAPVAADGNAGAPAAAESNAGAPAGVAAEQAPAAEPSPSQVASTEAASAQRRSTMPANLAAFLADAGIPLDSVTPREARRLLIQARTEARAEARAEAKRVREARLHPGRDTGPPEIGPNTFRTMPESAPATPGAGALQH